MKSKLIGLALIAGTRPGMTVVLPVGGWGLESERDSGAPVARTQHYLPPDGTTSCGIKSAGVLHTFGLAKVKPGEPFYFTTERQMTTWRGVLGLDGNLSDWKPWVPQGGQGIAVDAAGNVYLADGQIDVFDSSGKRIDTVKVPDRLQVMFGGRDG